jgi:hypothetical protein
MCCLHHTKARAQADALDNAIIDSLYSYAWEFYPKNAVIEYQASRAFYNMRVTQYQWTHDLIAQFNLNEANINPSSTNGANIYYPKYLVGLRLDLGTLIVRPLENKRARQEYNSAMWQVELQKSDIRSEIVKRVQMYKLAKSLLKIKTQALEESNTLQIVIRQRFQRNEISIEEYNRANISNLSFLQDKYTAEAQYNLAKNDLETLVTKRLETLKFLPKDF